MMLICKKQKLPLGWVQSNAQIEAEIEKKEKQSIEMKSPSPGDLVTALGSVTSSKPRNSLKTQIKKKRELMN